MDHLDDDVLIEILQRIPDLKEIHRCKCVSKRLYNTILTNYFVRCYLQHNASNDSSSLFGLFYQHPDQLDLYVNLTQNPVISFNFLPRDFPLDGLPVISVSNELVLHRDKFNMYFVSNMLTKHWCRLPPRPTKNYLWWLNGTCVGFLSKDFDTGSGSGGSFRVICISNKYVQLPVLVVDVYSSETGKWDTHTYNKGLLIQDGYWNAIACSGLLHWMCHGYVLVCDLYSDILRYMTIKLPVEEIDDKVNASCLGVCNGCLRFIKFSSGPIVEVKVWELNNYDNEGEWSLVLRDSFEDMAYHVSNRIVHIHESRVSFHLFDKDVVFLWHPNAIVLFNLRTRTMRLGNSFYPQIDQSCMPPEVFPIVLPRWPISLLPSISSRMYL